MTPIDTVAVIEAPEQVRFEFPVAGPFRRGWAWLVDLIVRGAIVLVIAILMSMAGGGGLGGEGFTTGATLVLFFAMEWGYFVVSEMLTGGRSLGKKAARLRVVKTAGHPIGFGDSVLRNLLRAADILPAGYALGLVSMTADARFRRLGDLVAGTMVVVEDSSRAPPPLRIDPPPTEAELARFPARPALDRDELEALEAFLRRVGTLSPAREDELADLIAPALAARVGLRYDSPSRFLALLYHRKTVG